jgi:hypothetical protein
VSALSALRPLVLSARRRASAQVCDICAAPLLGDHQHVVDFDAQRLCCACEACAVSFDGYGTRRHRTVPARVRTDPELVLGDEELAALGVPVGLFFLYYCSRTARWAGFFPGPAGPTEAELCQDACAALVCRSQLVQSLAPDVEALLVRHRPHHPSEAFAVPIDACYRLTALLRLHYRGFDGGDEARHVLDEFFGDLRRQSEAT